MLTGYRQEIQAEHDGKSEEASKKKAGTTRNP
jgi:hypothetical protein